MTHPVVLDTLLFTDDQVIFSSSEDDLQMTAHKLEQATRKFNLKISITKTKLMGFQGKEHMRTMNEKIIEQVGDFNYQGCNISYCERKEVNNKINKLQRMYGTLSRTLKDRKSVV